MRVVVVGAGAIGGVVGARLQRDGHDVTLVARGAHLDAMRRDGLRLATPDGAVTVRPTIVGSPGELGSTALDAVLLATKSQDTQAAVGSLADHLGADVPIVCLQNGVDNEPTALRHFAHVYGVAVMCPAAMLEPGRVVAYGSPTPGILDVGRYPSGDDDVAARLSAAFRGATFSSQTRVDIMRWKHRKLIVNVGNAVEALSGTAARQGPAGHLVTDEAERVIEHAGIPVVSRADDAAHRGDIVRRAPVDGQARPGGSMWQSLARGTGTIEADHLNGEIVRLARLHGVEAPVNQALQQLCRRAVVEGWPPAAVDADELLAHLEAAAGPDGLRAHAWADGPPTATRPPSCRDA
jgi:2-dehydropantoate 2-reductase